MADQIVDVGALNRLLLTQCLTKIELARRADLSVSTVKYVLSGTRVPSPLSLAKLARGLGVDVDVLTTDQVGPDTRNAPGPTRQRKGRSDG